MQLEMLHGRLGPSMAQRSHSDVSVPGISVLAVSPHGEDLRALEHIFTHSNWHLRTARNCEEAADLLRSATFPVIISDHRLPDGTWQDIDRLARYDDAGCRVLVSSRNADDMLWAEVLNEGGYDCLLKPFRTEEVYRLVSLAWRSWKNECERSRPRVLGVAAAG